MALLRFLLKRKIIVGMLVVFILFIGSYALTKLDQELFPPISFDMAVVQVDAGEMAALDVEKQITEPIEQTLSGIDGVDSYDSSSYIGQSSITVYIEEGRGDEVYKDIEAQVLPLESQLTGANTVYAFQISTNQPFDFFMSISGGEMEEMTRFANNIVKPRLEALPEVREVEFDGIEGYEVVITFDQEALEDLNTDVDQLIPFIQQSNVITSLGELTEEENKPTIRWDTTFAEVGQLENLIIPTLEGSKSLDELASVTLEKSEMSSGVWKDGSKDVIFTQVGRVPNVTQIEMAEAVRAEVEKIREEGLIDGFVFEDIVSQADYVADSIGSVTNNILMGGLLAIVVLILFLRNIRATFIIGLSIPASILLTFLSMWLLGYSFNMLTLIALGLGIGMMVDASIVILESIFKKKEFGYKGVEAVLLGVKEVASAVLASMLTTVVVFLPIGLLGGENGKFMMILSVTVIVTLVSSVIVSFTLIPTLSENFLKVRSKHKNKPEGWIIRSYGEILLWMTKKKRRRYGVISLFLIMFASSFLLVSKVPMTIMPDVFNRYAEIMVELDNGVTPAEKEAIADEINTRLQQIPDIKENFVLDSMDYMFVLINMTKDEEATLEQKEVNEQIFASLRELEEDFPVSSISSSVEGSGGSFPVQVEITGDNFDELKEIANHVVTELSSVDGIVGATTTSDKEVEEQLIVLKENVIKNDGLTAMQIASQLSSHSTRQPIGELLNLDATPIYVETDQTVSSKRDLLNYRIDTPEGKKRLSNYVELETVMAPTQIDRKDGERVIKVLADYHERDLGSVNREVQSVIDAFDSPEGYQIAISGDLQAQQEAMEEMILILAIAIFLVFVVMAIQFNHLIQPLIVMTVIPTTITGVILGLAITQRELSIMSGMGVIMLIGIVLNNAILLIDRTNQLRVEEQSIHDAVVEAGKSRIRPIFMTTLTTIGGMLPLAISTGIASNYQAPLATVVISGLLFSTLITLVLIPAVYLFVNDIGNGLKRLWNRKSRKRHVDVKTIES